VVTTAQKTQRSIVNFNSASTTLLETLSGCPNLLTYDVHRIPCDSGCYKLDVDATCSIEGYKWGIDAIVRDYEGVVVAVSCSQVFSLLNSEVAEALAMQKGLKFAKEVFFLNLIA